jgi:hypothetical protein
MAAKQVVSCQLRVISKRKRKRECVHADSLAENMGKKGTFVSIFRVASHQKEWRWQ